MSEDVATVDRAELGRLERLGKGGTAVIHRLPEFRLPGLPPLVFKEYDERTRAFAGPALRTGLLTLVRQRLRMDEPTRSRWDERIAWALRVVDDGPAACGILLPLITDRYFQDLRDRNGTVTRTPREVDLLFGATDDMARVGLSETSPRMRLGVAVQIAKVCAQIHEQKTVLGDISGRNMVYDTAGERPRVMVVDADGARVEGNRGAFGSQPQTPHWEPPEALLAAQQLRVARKRGDQPAVSALLRQTMVQNRATDVYKVGLMLVRVVDHGRGKAVNRKPKVAVDIFRRTWGRHAAEALERSLSDRPAQRPSARELYESMHKRTTPAAPAAPVKKNAPPIAEGTKIGLWTFRENAGWVRDGS